MEDSLSEMIFNPNELEFPTIGVLPKQETGAAMFLQQYPGYDGKDVTVAILDTGCDPGSDGLITTPDGKPKFIDVIDATGSGDVDTTTIVKMDPKTRLVTGLTSRSLKIPESWPMNKENEFRIGLLRCNDVFPKVLLRRLNRERSKKFDEIHNKRLDNLRGEIENLQKLAKTENKDDNSLSSTSSDGSTRMDLTARIEDSKKLLALLENESCTNCGPVFDVLVWNTGADNGNEWLAYLDTSSCKSYYNCEDTPATKIVDLSLYESVNRPMTNFRVRQEYTKISEFDNANYVLNIYDNGNCVSVVVPAGSHGTHVAGIVGAYFKDDATKNGVAPGCQLVSIKIGDTRLGSMETNQGLLRAVKYIKELKCDLCNMSYGEPTTFPFYGAFPDAINDLVWKYNSIFVSSAGNDGPCLTTAGAPQSASPAIIGIGAIFSSNLVEAAYCLANSNLPLNSYTWSSRGPTSGGAMGVKLCAPGGAIAPVPTFTLNKHQLMNGTSMSSPNACGNIALLLSGLKAQNIDYSANGVETALVNTAKLLPNVEQLSIGYGLIQIHKAFDYCVKQKESIVNSIGNIIEMPVHFEISVSGGPNNTASGERGIYIREANLLNKVYSYNVYVNPVFRDDFSNEVKTDFELKCSLKSNAPNWVNCANFALIAHGGRSFQIKIDARQFKKFLNSANSNGNLQGNGYKPVYMAEVLGFDSKNVNAGPLFRVPITVVNPIVYDSNSRDVSLNNGFINNWQLAANGNSQSKDNSGFVFTQTDDFRVGSISRVFHSVPQGVCAAKVSIKAISTGDDKPTRFSFATVYTKGYQAVSFDRWFRATTGSTHEFMLQVESSTVLETTLTQYALDDNVCRLEWRVEFVGPLLSSDVIYLNENSHFTEIAMRTSVVEALDLKPSVSFDRYITYVAPKYATTGTLSADRGDLTVNDEMYYYLELEYEFDSECKGDTYFSLPKISDLLYESYLAGIFYMIFDKNKKLIGSGEAFRETIKLDKSDKYLYKIQIRHSSLKLLESIKNMKLQINYPLPSVSSDIFYGKRSLLQNKNKVSSLSLPQFSSKKLYIASPSKEVAIKNIQPGDHISGWLKLNSSENNALKPRFRNTGCRGPATYCIKVECALGPANGKKAPKSRNDDSSNGGNNGKDEEKETPSLEEKQRDVVIGWVKKLTGKEQLDALETYIINDLLKKYSNHLPLLELKMSVYNSVKDKKLREKYLPMVIDAADEILNAIDQNAVATHFGRNGDTDDKEWVKADKKFKEEKQVIIRTLFTKLSVVFEMLSKEEETLEAERDAANAGASSDDNGAAGGGAVQTNASAAAAADATGADSGAAGDSDVKQEEKSDVVVVTAAASASSASGHAMIKPVLAKDKLVQFDALVKEIKQWTNIEKDKTCKDDYFAMKVWRLKQDQKYGEMLSLINENDNNGNKKKKFEETFKAFKKYFGNRYEYLVRQKELAKFEEFPSAYRLF